MSVGLSVTGGISRLLPMLVGLGRAKELLLLGERVDRRRGRAASGWCRAVPAGEHEQVAAWSSRSGSWNGRRWR